MTPAEKVVWKILCQNKTKDAENSDFRNNSSKCWFNDTGYCKFKEECRQQHSSSICQSKACDNGCPDRHPQECKFKERCRFLDKGMCAFSHDYAESENENLIKRIEALEKEFERNKTESDTQIKQLKEEMKTFKRDSIENVEHMNKRNEILKNDLKQENAKLVQVIDELKVKIDNQKTIKAKEINEVENRCNKVIKEALKKQDKSIQEAIKDAINLFRVDIKSDNTLNNVNIGPQNGETDKGKKA